MPDTSVYLLEIDAWTGSAVETLYYSSHSKSTGPHDTPANTFYDGRLVDAGKFSRSLFQDGGTLGTPSSNVGLITLNNADGALDPWLDYGFDGRAWRLKQLPDITAPVSSAGLVFRGTLQGIDSSDATRVLRLRTSDRLSELQHPLLTTRYAGTTTGPGATAEGDASLKDQIKPWVFGAASNVPCVLANAFNLLYQVSGGAVSSIIAKDGAFALANAGDYPVLSSLIAATLIPGQYATCLALGIFRLGGAPALTVTADVVEGATLALRSAARVMQRMLSLFGWASADIGTANFDALHAFNPAEIGIVIADDSNADALLGQVGNSIGGAILPDQFGVLQAISVSLPTGDPVDTFTIRDIANENTTLSLVSGPSQEGQGVPAYAVTLTWGRIWQKMTTSEIVGAVDDATRAVLTSQQDRKATAQDSSILTAHPKAVQINVDTLLTTQAAALAEAVRRLAMYGSRRDRLLLEITLTFDRAEAIQIGSVAQLMFSAPIERFGYGAGKNFLVIGRIDDFTKRLTSLELWG
jgi:hypothetical protein